MTWSAAAAGIMDRIGLPLRRQDGCSPESLVTALYRGVHRREPDAAGLANTSGMLRAGEPLEEIVKLFVDSPEFRSRFLQSLVPPAALPDLRQAMPERYEIQQAGEHPMAVYLAREDADLDLMASLIERHRYYDHFGVWTPVIDADKEITAAIVRGLGAGSCFELGCFTGPVLSLLADAGVSVAGSDVSHLAFAFAYPNIRDAIIYGDLLDLPINRTFDVVLCMDVLEHLNPRRLDAYLEKILSLLVADGYLYVNAPMWGEDRTFGTFEAPYLAEWHEVGDRAYWRHWPCDHTGWPIHGHLVWASSGWWERWFAAHGLVRDDIVEAAIHRTVGPIFAEHAPGRRCLFALHRAASRRSSAAVAAEVEASLRALTGSKRGG